MDRHGRQPDPPAPVGDPTPIAAFLVQSAIRRRRAHRAFEERVRAMARRAKGGREERLPRPGRHD